MLRWRVLPDPLGFVLLLLRFALGKIEMTFDLNFLSFVERPREQRSFELGNSLQATYLGIEITPGSETFFSSFFQRSSLPFTEYFDS